MRSRFKLLGHPAHPIMVVFPLAFYPLAAIAEVVYIVLVLAGWHNADKILTFDVGFFWRAGFLMLVVGWLGQMAASLPGLIDWLNIPNDAPAKDKATFHFIVAIIMGGISFMAILLLNWGEPPVNFKMPDNVPSAHRGVPQPGGRADAGQLSGLAGRRTGLSPRHRRRGHRRY